MKNTGFQLEDSSDDIIGKGSISPEQKTKLNNVLAKKT